MKGYIYVDVLGSEIEEIDIPEDMKALSLEYRSKMIEALSDWDDVIMGKYLEGEQVSEDELRAA